MALAGDVLGKQDRAGAEPARLAVAHGDFDVAGEVNHELTARRVMPVDEVFLAVIEAEDHRLGRNRVGHLRGAVGILHLDGDVLEMGLAILVGVNARVSHRVAPSDGAVVGEIHSRRTRARIGDDVDHGGFSRGRGAFERGADVLRLVDVLAVSAEDLSHLVIAAEAEVAAGAHTAEGRPAAVVVDDGQHRDVVAHHGVDFHAVHAERAVAAKNDDLRVGLGDLRAHSERDGDAHAAVGAGVDRVAGGKDGDRLAREVEDLVTVGDDNRVAVHEVADFLAQAQGMNRDGIGTHQLLGLDPRLFVVAAQGIDPRQFLASVKGVAGFADQLLQDHFGVADDADVDRAVAADLFVGDIDLSDLDIGRPSWRQAEADDEVEAGADDQHGVAFFPCLVAGAEEAERMVLGDDAAALRGGVERDAGELDKFLEFVHRARPEHARPAQDQRALGLLEHRDGLLDEVGVARDARRCMRPARIHHFAVVDAAIEDVAREVNVNRSGLSAGGDAKGLVDDLGNTAGVDDAFGPLGDRLEHRHLIHFLERAHPDLRQGAGAAEGDHGHRVEEGVADAGDEVGGTRAGGREAYARFAAYAAVGVGGHGSRLLVAKIDCAKAFDAAQGNVHHRPAGQVKYGFYSLVLERIGDEIVPADFGHCPQSSCFPITTPNRAAYPNAATGRFLPNPDAARHFHTMMQACFR